MKTTDLGYIFPDISLCFICIKNCSLYGTLKPAFLLNNLFQISFLGQLTLVATLGGGRGRSSPRLPLVAYLMVWWLHGSPPTVLLPGSGSSSSTWCGQGVGWVMCGYSLGVGWVLCVCVWTHGSGAVEAGLAVERQGAAAGAAPIFGCWHNG